MNLFKRLRNESEAIGKQSIGRLPQLDEKMIQGVELVSIKHDFVDAFLKADTIDSIIRNYNRTFLRLTPHTQVHGNDQEQMMEIHIRFLLINGARLIMWPSDYGMDELVVSYWNGKSEVQKYVESPYITAFLSRELESLEAR